MDRPIRYVVPTMAALAWVLGAEVSGCPYSIRDAGFIVRDPRSYHACVCSSERFGNVADLAAQVEDGARKLLPESNVTAAVVDTDRQPDEPAAVAAGPLTYRPAMILVSPEGKAIPLHTFDRGSPLKPLERDLDAAVRSPARERLRELLIEGWCVFVLKESGDEAADTRARSMAQDAAEAAVGMTSEMGQVIDRAPPVLAVSHDDDEERVLLWSLGLLEQPEVGIAVVSGAGRRLGPVVWHAEITSDALLAYVRLLGCNCTCTSDPSAILGPTVPMVWDGVTRQRVREALGFDPDSPQVRNTLSGVWAMVEMGGGEADISGFDPGYTEIPIGPAEGEGGNE